MRRQTRLRLVGGLVAGAVVLGGCSSKHEASDSLPLASAPTTTAELPPLGPPDFPVPNGARQKTANGAEAFIAYYIELSNLLLPTLDSQPLRQLSTECQTCDDLADGYDDSKASGYRYEGGRISITSAGEAAVKGDAAEIAFVLQQDAVTVYDASGKLLKERSAEASRLNGGASMVWDEEIRCWTVTKLTAEPQ